jgi:hypothetical protein
MKIYKSLIFLTLTCIAVCSCNNQGSEKNKEETQKQKLSPNEIYSQKVDATCTILTDIGQGSGFFVDSNIIVTNYHVIADAKFFEVVLNNVSKKYNVIGYLAIDKINDLVLLMVDYNNKCLFNIEREIPNPGDHVFSISTPIGLTKILSDGLISGKKNFEGRKLIQITVPISHGSSGCPIINEYGDVVGIAVGGIEEGNNLNFCIPTSYLTTLLDFKESYPTTLGSEQRQDEPVKQEKPQSIKNPNSQNNDSSKTSSSTKETSKKIYMKPSEIVTDDDIKKQLLNSFYNDPYLSFIHNVKRSSSIDYNSIQFFEFQKSFYYNFQGEIIQNSGCVKYLITFTEINPDKEEKIKKYYKQYYLNASFKVITFWATFDEKDKYLNYWASYKPEYFNTPCE